MQHAGYMSTRLDLPNGCSACFPRQNHASTRVPLIRKNCFGNPKVEMQRKDNNTSAEKQTQMHAGKQIWWYPVFFWISSSKYSLVCVRGAPCVCVCVCVCDFSLTKGIREACLKYSVWFPLRPSGEDRSLLETDSVCMNHSVGVRMCVCVCVCVCVILHVYMYRTLFVPACSRCRPSYPRFPRFLPLSYLYFSAWQPSSARNTGHRLPAGKTWANVICASQSCCKTPH